MNHPTRSTEAFFGRRHGKTLKPWARKAIDEVLPTMRLPLGTPPPDILSDVFAHRPSSIGLEIGFGAGEHLLDTALRNAGWGFIGVEPFVNSLATFLRDAADNNISNVLLHDDDATVVLDWLPSASLSRIDLFYPDPWHKKKHWKRRFVSQRNLARFARVLKPSGLFRFASDIETYVDWTIEHCDQHPEFTELGNSPHERRQPYEHWPGTRYEAKAFREGRVPSYLTFQRR